ncbi:hypothetical protein OVA24_04550 [Luteolibacter sp. SL250]|uniref:hypothetical protein n=1 Tax=Luteolibacter sp. SL250 TaxID=2995170 RepID=UPI00226E04A6|nr:hypothetical protein [Luteolibacter sp. SL250]WAC20649.1 hypothetical protein OVA24_04550 [Luteolibacter sp. SL250]
MRLAGETAAARLRQIMLVELKCNNCGSQLKPEDISPQLSAARCHHCNALFALPHLAGGRTIARPDVALPRGMKIEERMDGLTITRRWLDATAWFLLIFAVFWNGFMIVWSVISLSQGIWAMSLFGLLHTGVGLFLIYLVLAMFLNSTTVKVTYDAVETRSGPLPWKGNKTIPKHEVEQFYCTEKVQRTKNGSSVTYDVHAVLKGNRREKLAQGIRHHDQALFIEQQLERHLGLQDVPVAGEHGR